MTFLNDHISLYLSYWKIFTDCIVVLLKFVVVCIIGSERRLGMRVCENLSVDGFMGMLLLSHERWETVLFLRVVQEKF